MIMADRHDWLLQALSHQKDGRLTPVQVQKNMFLMKMEAGRKVGRNFYNFVPYNYGPFCADIYRDLESLRDQGLLEINNLGRSWSAYSITDSGRKAAGKAQRNLNDKAIDYLGKATDWVTSLTFVDLLKAIYAKYPKYKKNSVFVG
jgi:uncharacterized protein YwgA